MEEYFARQRRRRLVGAACSLVVFAAVFVVELFAMFRTHSNYQFRSIADFFYQTLLAPAQLDYEFVDQNVSEAQIGPYTIRTMSIQVGEDTRLVQAVAVPSFSESITVFRSFRQTNIMAQKHEVLWRYTRHGIH